MRYDNDFYRKQRELIAQRVTEYIEQRPPCLQCDEETIGDFADTLGELYEHSLDVARLIEMLVNANIESERHLDRASEILIDLSTKFILLSATVNDGGKPLKRGFNRILFGGFLPEGDFLEG